MHTERVTAEAATLAPRPGVFKTVDAGRVELLFDQSISGLAVTVAMATLCVVVLWRELAPAALLSWYAALLAVVAARFALTRRFRLQPARTTPRRWENAFSAGAAASGVLWGALPTLLHPHVPAYEMFVAFVVGGMIMGAVGILGASAKAFICFAAPMFVAEMLDLLLLGGRVQLGMAAGGLVYILAIAKIYRDVHRAIVANIERGIAIERLSAEQRGVLDAAPVGVAFLEDQRVLDCNAELERLLGRSRAALVGASMRVWFPNDASWERARVAAQRAQRDTGAYREELQLARGDGDLIWLDVSARPIVPGAPERGEVVVCAEIGAQKATEAALRASNERLDIVMRATQSGLWDWELDSGRRHVSARFKEILGFPPEADIERVFSLSDRLHPEDRARVLAAIEMALAGRKPFDEEARLRRADDTWVWVHASAQVTNDRAGNALRFTGSISDISQRKNVQERLRQSEAHFRHLVETANDLVWAVARDGRWTYLSPRATRQIFGCEPEDMIGTKLTASQTAADCERTESMLARVLDEGTASHFETLHFNRKNEGVTLSLNATPLRDASGAIIGVTGTATDITLLKKKEAELSAALAEQELIFESASEGIVFLKNRLVHKANSKFAAMLGYETRELAGQPSIMWYAHPAEWEPLGREVDAALAREQVFQSELLVKRKDGEAFWCEVRGRAVAGADRAAGSIWVYIDISARKEREQRIQHLADHDALTGLLNRRLLEDRLRQAIGLARREDKLAAIMLVDLDAFKQINDGYGHLTGDYVLRSVAKRLKECVRETDTVARLGGDEFVVLLPGQKSTDDAAIIAEKILAALVAPIAAGGRDFAIGASIGISIFPRDGQTPDALIKHADAAMYRVKEAGKNHYEFYSDRSGTGQAAT